MNVSEKQYPSISYDVYWHDKSDKCVFMGTSNVRPEIGHIVESEMPWMYICHYDKKIDNKIVDSVGFLDCESEKSTPNAPHYEDKSVFKIYTYTDENDNDCELSFVIDKRPKFKNKKHMVGPNTYICHYEVWVDNQVVESHGRMICEKMALNDD